MTQTLPAPGLGTFGKYQIIAKLADGPMGLVYKASDPATGATVAIKVGSISLATDKVLLKRFEQEFHCTSNLSHPNIVRALEFGWENSRPFIVMEFVDGENVAARIKHVGRLSEADAVAFIIQVAQGLHQAHKNGIIHRDIKPENILLTANGQAKLANLGLSKNLETNMQLTCDYSSLGTPTFIAPEQFGDAKHSGVRCDIYSLGATLYMAAPRGKVPFTEAFLLTILKQKLTNNIVPPRQNRADPERAGGPDCTPRPCWRSRVSGTHRASSSSRRSREKKNAQGHIRSAHGSVRRANRRSRRCGPYGNAETRCATNARCRRHAP